MFSDNKKLKQDNMESSTQQNIIAQGTKIVGDIASQGPFRIDGTIEGNVKTSGKVVVGKTGFIKGTLQGENADFEGSFRVNSFCQVHCP
jgi:cytoskeletal protein CcmA (bactofilin family)